MSMYFVGIDISKYKHDCCIISAADQQIVSKFTVKNDKDGFEHLLTTLNSLSNPEDIKIGFESTAHYALNLELFLENAHHSFMEVNPVLIKEYKKSTTLRRTKTDSVDCESIARWLMTVEYKPHSKGFYHSYSLKSLTRLREFVSSNHWHFFQVPCFMGKSLLAWAFALHKHAAVWAPIIQAPHTGALITHAL